MYITINNSNSPSFEKFIKIKGNKKDLNLFRQSILKPNSDFITISSNDKKKSNLFILTGKDAKKVLNKISSGELFIDICDKLNDILGKKPDTMTLKTAKKKFDQKSLF